MPGPNSVLHRTDVILSVAIAALIASGVLAWSAVLGESYVWRLPPGVPAPIIPPDNPMSEAKVELGRRLFYDRRLSVNGTLSCGDCHNQALAFTDGRSQAIGATGEVHPRSSMSLTNIGYATHLGWANPPLDKLETQAPVEMGLAGHQDDVLSLIATDPFYRPAFRETFDGAFPYTLQNVAKAIAAFERTLISADSPYDRFVRGDESALSAAARRGMELFYSERLACFRCHGGFNFNDATAHDDQAVAQSQFHNTGLYNVDGRGGYPALNTGAKAVTSDPDDMGRFCAPTLRNIAVTAPYMHDGSVESLDNVINHYAAGGRATAGPTGASPLRSPFVPGFIIDEAEKRDLIAFLESLTDVQFLTNPRFANPFRDTVTAAAWP